MKKYNYFDDEPDEISPQEEQKKFLPFKSPKSLVGAIRGGAENASEALKTMPNLRHALIKALWIIGIIIVLIIIAVSFSHSLKTKTERAQKFNSDAGNVCINYIKEYGSVKWEELSEDKYGENKAKLTGLSYARQMDFNGDGSDELMVCYNSDDIYYLEVWGYRKKSFVCLYKDEANSSEDSKDGWWVSFYRKGDKYYICKSEKSDTESLKLYALRNGKFKNKGTATYDVKSDVYYISGKESTSEFETIKLSCFRKSRGDIIVEQVTANIDSFGDITSEAITNELSNDELKQNAYYEVVQKRIEKYGEPEVVKESGVSYIDGVAMVRLIDFNGDDNDELMIIYRTNKSMSKYDSYSGEYVYYDEPRYSIDIYSWDGNNAERILNKDSISRYFENDEVFYLLLKKNKNSYNLCSNTYDMENKYEYTARSNIYKLKKGEFSVSFSAKLVYDYGYKTYYIDGETVYDSEWEKKSTTVPMFLDDEDTIDSGKYEITYFSGESESAFAATVSETESVIKSLESE